VAYRYGQALDESIRKARQTLGDHELALALDALTVLKRLTGTATESFEDERDAILERLGVIRTPAIPLGSAVALAG
jgi:hypothetical protein